MKVEERWRRVKRDNDWDIKAFEENTFDRLLGFFCDEDRELGDGDLEDPV